MMIFWIFDFYKTFKCYWGYFNLNFYIGKKVQKNFIMGLKFGEVEGQDFFFSKSQKGGRFLDFRPKF